MKSRITKSIMTILAIILVAGLTGCGKFAPNNSDMPMDDMMMSGTIKPSELVFERMEEYSFPYMGLSFKLPESLMKKMDKQDIAMLPDEMANDDNTHRYALVAWAKMTEEQRNAEVEMQGNGYFDWFDSLERVGALGMYSTEMKEEELNKATFCDTHTELGMSKDGKFKYYLSINSAADPEAIQEMNDIKTTFTEMVPIPVGFSAFMDPSDMPEPSDVTEISSVSTETIDGKAFTQADFAKYDLTMVNVFATWCTACIQEIPDIEKLYQEMKDKGVNVIGIVLDTVDQVDSDGKTVENQSIIDLAKQIQKKTGATYPFLKPDAGLYNGRLSSSYALPETFFVDKDGNIVGETYTGSHDFEEWKGIVEKELEALKGK